MTEQEIAAATQQALSDLANEVLGGSEMAYSNGSRKHRFWWRVDGRPFVGTWEESASEAMRSALLLREKHRRKAQHG